MITGGAAGASEANPLGLVDGVTLGRAEGDILRETEGLLLGELLGLQLGELLSGCSQGITWNLTRQCTWLVAWLVDGK